MKTRILLTFLSIAFLGVGTAIAQWAKSITLSTLYDDNAFRNYEEVSDYVTQISAYIARDGGTENWQTRLFYRGGYNLFASFGQRNFHHHQLGMVLAHSLNARGDVLNLGANIGLRLNRGVYSYFSFTTATAFANTKHYLNSETVANVGYRISGRWYSDLPEFSNVEHYFFARLSRFFATRTTFIVEANYGRKIYLQQTFTPANQPDEQDHYGRLGGGRGHMSGGGWNDSRVPVPSREVVGQAVGLLRVAQSLSNTTGLSVQFLLRRNPIQSVRYLAGQVSGYSTEDELFDDRYGYESEELRATLTQLLPWRMTLTAGTEGQWKDYVKRPALDLSGQPIPSGENRKDRRLAAWVRLSKTFALRDGGHYFTFLADFYWLRNHSNDSYYRYSNTIFSLGLSTEF